MEEQTIEMQSSSGVHDPHRTTGCHIEDSPKGRVSSSCNSSRLQNPGGHGEDCVPVGDCGCLGDIPDLLDCRWGLESEGGKSCGRAIIFEGVV